MSERTEPEGETLELAHYAQQAYLEYALSVVKGRALPDVCDGQKPVQRRILYSMSRMGLGFGGANGNVGARPVKSARVVGDVLGRFHPHGDQAAYDAMVRMAQDFSQRYPLVDGQGNFGSRDGDNAAAMRYTEARLAKITSLLLDEIDMGTVEFIPNYDGSTEEPKQLPARLPFNLLNGASGIAVGLATEIPSHNLGEVASACVALIKNANLTDDELFAIIPAPDYPSGGQIISPAADMAQAYKTGRGSLKVRARWHIEDLARGQWQLVVDELPPGVSTASVLGEIEEISNPKVKAGKKALLTEQVQLKATFLSVVDTVRDESNKDALVRIVIEPKSSRIEQQDLINTLLAHTLLETSSSINMTAIGIDGRPIQKSLRQMLNEWILFRAQTIERRSKHRLGKVLERIHILEGRQLVLLNIDEVIAIIRQSEEPKAALIARFKLSERQAEDILEIRLRQLARLEAIKIEQELSELRKEQEKLEEILHSPATLKRLMIKEIEADAKTFTDARRTLIQEERRVVAEIKIVDEPMTVIVSAKGWVRTQKAHGVDTSTLTFKAGDTLHATFECRSIDALIVFGTANDKGVRVYSVAVSSLPGGRGDGQPISSLIELEAGTQAAYYFAGAVEEQLLISSSGGYGFYASVANMISRQRAGKAFVSLGAGETLNAPTHIPAAPQANADGALQAPAPTRQVLCASREGRLLSFALTDLRQMAGGGRGLMLMDIDNAKDKLAAVAVLAQGAAAVLVGVGRGGKEKTEKLDPKMIAMTIAPRGRKGKVLDVGFKVTGIKTHVKGDVLSAPAK
ncbi:MAG: DNA topoisomerase IV subunit A [Cytophagales bacterium]|nr:DNA topoisomerase IV subunit A [Cytophagales bacterium]